MVWKPNTRCNYARDRRHIIVDTLGMILKANVHGADIQDRDGFKQACDGLIA